MTSEIERLLIPYAPTVYDRRNDLVSKIVLLNCLFPGIGTIVGASMNKGDPKCSRTPDKNVKVIYIIGAIQFLSSYCSCLCCCCCIVWCWSSVLWNYLIVMNEFEFANESKHAAYKGYDAGNPDYSTVCMVDDD